MFQKPAYYFTAGAVLLTQAAFAGTVGASGPEAALYQPLATFTIGPDFVHQRYSPHFKTITPTSTVIQRLRMRAYLSALSGSLAINSGLN